MSDESKPFTVTDRRHFTHEGEVRPTEEEESVSAPVQTAAPRDEPVSAKDHAQRQNVGADSISFQEFLISLGAQGARLLMETEAGSVEDRAAGVRHYIALLEMLSDKTEGRRTPEEDQMLTQLLFELRTGYLAQFKGS